MAGFGRWMDGWMVGGKTWFKGLCSTVQKCHPMRNISRNLTDDHFSARWINMAF
jgi:hypothetical protein